MAGRLLMRKKCREGDQELTFQVADLALFPDPEMEIFLAIASLLNPNATMFDLKL